MSEELPDSSKEIQHFIFLSAMCKVSNFPTSLQTLVIICLFYSSHSSSCEVASHCVFISFKWFFHVCFLSIQTLFPNIQYTIKCWLDLIEGIVKAVIFVVFVFYFSKCPAGTCDGCTFYFLWESSEACPLCTEHDFHEIEGACKRGFQVRSKTI